GAYDGVVVLERDDLPRVLVAEILIAHTLDDAIAGADREPWRLTDEAHQAHYIVAADREEFRDRRTATKVRRRCGRGQRRQVEDVELVQLACAREHTDLTARSGAYGRYHDIVLGTPALVGNRGVVGGTSEQTRRRHQHPARIVG